MNVEWRAARRSLVFSGRRVVAFGPGGRDRCAIWQAGRLRAPDLIYAGILPPLVFAGSALVLHQFLPAGNSGNIVVREALDLASTLASSAPLLFTGTLLAIALAAVRWRHERARRKRRHRARV